MKLDKRLGNGAFGVVFTLTKYPNYTIKFSPFFTVFEEYKTLKIAYMKLSKYPELKEYLIEPIDKWECKLEGLNTTVKNYVKYAIKAYTDRLDFFFDIKVNGLANPVTPEELIEMKKQYYKEANVRYEVNMELCAIIVLSNLGENTLDKIMEKPMTENFQLEVMFQLISIVTYINKAGLSHQDLKSDNVVVRKNTDKRVTFTIENKRYTIQPKMFVYPIDYGLSKFKADSTADFVSLAYMFNKFSLFKKNKEKLFPENAPMNGSVVKKKFMNLIHDGFFSEIMVKSSVCSIL
jgi:serine/threonine protein kinase